MVKSEVALLSR